MGKSFLRSAVLIGMILAFSVSRAEEPVIPPLLVITDLRIVGESSEAEANAFSDFLRAEIERTGMYRILSRSSMLAILKSKSFPYPCYDLPCFAAMGKLLGADEVLAGNFKRWGRSVEITLRRIHVEEERFLNTIHQTAAVLDSSGLMGAWGRQLISETFNIDPRLLAPPGGEATIVNVEAKPYSLPESITRKYPGMIYIPAGVVTVGSQTGDPCEMPPHRVTVEPFYIGKYEVTNEEYHEFVVETGRESPSHWVGNTIPPGLEKHPVTWISFEDAEAYCLWKGGRLPTEAEWERAARGGTQRAYPWGNEFDPNRANTWQSGRRGTAPAGSYPLGASPFGVEDMAGNVFEWVDGFFEPYPGSRFRISESEKHYRVLRGGSWNFSEYYARTTHRFSRSGGDKSRSFGFRLARNP